MSSFARPSADAFNGANWQNQLGSTSNLFQSIDETSPDDTNFVSSPAAPSNLVYVCNLSSVPDPGIDTGMSLFARLAKSPTSASQIDMAAELRQGYVNEGTQGTLICTITATNVGTSFVTFQHDLSTTEAGTISDFAALFIRFTANQV